MLQRAASNAYSWWWASHIRTKQSKWIDNNLHEMDDRVKKMLKVIELDADSFGKRAEIYFQRRPELISYVEDAYRAYRALAERYDHISGELHKANHTIATAFPDDVHYGMLEEEEEDDNFPKAITPIDAGKINKPTVEALINKRRHHLSVTERKGDTSMITKENAQEEISKLQKGILALQTEKEFIKSSYENLVGKYWEIEKQMSEMQEEVFYLEEQFDTSAVIEDDEARSLMTATALKSCEDAIGRLEEQRIKSMEQAKIEFERIKSVKEKLKALKGDNNQSEMETTEYFNEGTEMMSTAEEAKEQVYSLNKEGLELQSVCEKVKEHFPDTSVEEIAEKIDELVNKVIELELTVSSQTAQINRLNSENDHLENYLHTLEEEKTLLIDDSNELTEKLKEAEEELRRVQTLEKAVQDEEIIFRKNITEISRSLSGISDKLQSPKHQEIASMADLRVEEGYSTFNIETQRQCEDKEVTEIHDISEELVEDIHVTQELGGGLEDYSESAADSQLQTNSTQIRDLEEENELKEKHSFHAGIGNNVGNDQETPFDKEDLVEDIHVTHELGDGLGDDSESEADSQLQSNSIQIQDLEKENESKEKDSFHARIGVNKENDQESQILLAEYTSVLRNYKEVTKRLSEEEKEKENYLHETTTLIRELKNAIAMKDEEIRFLRQVLESSNMNSNSHGNNPFLEAGNTLQGHGKIGSISYASNPQYPEMSGISNLEPTATRNKSNYGSDIVSILGEFINVQLNNEGKSTSPIEEKFRRDIDTVLDENLKFWLRFSTSFHHVLEFQTKYEDIQADLEKLHGSMGKEGNDNALSDQIKKPEKAAVAGSLRTLKSELHVWLEQSALLRGELESRFSSLCSIQKEISEALKASSESEEVQLTPYQAAKFQGEVLNMQQENKKVASELQVAQNHARELQAEVEKELSNIYESHETYTPRSSNHDHSSSPRRRVPLSVFLFGTKPKKPSIFARINPAFQKQYSHFRSRTAKH